MRDYTEDETGKIACVSFDFISVGETTPACRSVSYNKAEKDRPLKDASPYSYKPSGV